MAGHALGNLLLAGLAAVTGDFVAAVDERRPRGLDPDVARVLPATVEPVVLRSPSPGPGGELAGRWRSRAGGIDRVAVEPAGARAPAAVEALVDADQIVLGPGSLYTSVLAAAVVDEVARHRRSRGRVVYVCNLRAEGTETFGYDVADHVAALRRHGIAPDVVVAQAGGLPLGVSQSSARRGGAGRRCPAPGLAHDGAKLSGRAVPYGARPQRSERRR